MASWRRTWVIAIAVLFVFALTAYHAPVVGTPPVNLEYNTPSEAYRRMLSRFAEDVQYITTMYFGGQANQALAMMNLLYIAKHSGRVAILPQFTAYMFGNLKERADFVFDLARLYDSTGIVAVPLPVLKWSKSVIHHPLPEIMPCWSTMELKTGSSNYHPPTSPEENGLVAHNIETSFWACPPLPFTSDSYVLKLSGVVEFVRNVTSQNDAVARAQADLLPQKWLPDDVDVSGVDPESNIKPTFDPLDPFPPTVDDQLICLDATYFMGEDPPPPPHPQDVPLDAWRQDAWREVGQFMHYNKHVENLADAYLMQLFKVHKVEDLPPFITMHIRRRDFHGFKGFTYAPLSHYQDALVEVRAKIQNLLDAPESSHEHGRPRLHKHEGIDVSQYQIVVATDEDPTSPFRQELAELGWIAIDHNAFKTTKKYGPWYPSLIDGEILSRGHGFVGTTWSTYSLLAGQRVEYWRGGAQVIAKPGIKPS
ncbi:hypothetical protein OIO90_003756 [Microbotryomycetes sp. JL221]|nr:hypothetical protein OIO90_003756 [Microbotryomycetes sp. JL221]